MKDKKLKMLLESLCESYGISYKRRGIYSSSSTPQLPIELDSVSNDFRNLLEEGSKLPYGTPFHLKKYKLLNILIFIAALLNEAYLKFPNKKQKFQNWKYIDVLDTINSITGLDQFKTNPPGPEYIKFVTSCLNENNSPLGRDWKAFHYFLNHHTDNITVFLATIMFLHDILSTFYDYYLILFTKGNNLAKLYQANIKLSKQNGYSYADDYENMKKLFIDLIQYFQNYIGNLYNNNQKERYFVSKTDNLNLISS